MTQRFVPLDDRDQKDPLAVVHYRNIDHDTAIEFFVIKARDIERDVDAPVDSVTALSQTEGSRNIQSSHSCD